MLLTAAVLRADTTVFADGRVRLPVVVAADAAPEERAAAEELARVLGAMSGLDWPVRTESAGDRAGPVRTESEEGRGGSHRWDGTGFFVGRTRAAARDLIPLRAAADLLAPTAEEIGPDGFRIITQGGRVFLQGATPEATANAVSWLLQHDGGVRWYAPGPLGEVIPRRTEWTLPELRVVREPAYVSREITGVDATWARRNGLRQRLEYSHNLTHVFPPELGAAHPEWFPLVQGQRLLPASKADWNWQPDLARPEVAEWSAQQAAEAFARTPGRASFSLGMNDSVRFDQGEATRAVVEPLRYFRGMPDYSPLVFGFMNRAAEQLERQPAGEARQPAQGSQPGKYLGCLAYFWCENVPTFSVHPRVVPYVTTDRTQFYDAAYRADDYALMSRWGRSGVRAFGLWEYAEGDAFVVPRVPHAMLAEAVREGWWRGARAYTGECGPHWGFDAFKVWMLAQLLWEPGRTTAELEDDFFNGWYGPAAEPMRRFFARCEAQWMAQAGPPWWIKYYRQQDQVLLFPPEVCRELRGLLVEAERTLECGGSTPLSTGRLDGPPDFRQGQSSLGRAARAAASSRGAESGVEPPHSKAKPEAAYAARVALTSRAFAVTEAAVEFGRVRSALVAADETMAVAVLAPLLQQLQRARFALERAAGAAARKEGSAEDRAGAAAAVGEGSRSSLASADVEAGEAGCVPLLRSRGYAADGTQPAMATGDVAYLLRNDPVPRLLAALGRRDPQAPAEALAGLMIAGDVPMDSAVTVPVHWEDLASAYADGGFARLKERLPNGDFSRVAPGRQEPVFLYPRWGELPADWTVRGIATEAGRVALVPGVDGVEQAVRFEGAWETQLTTTLPATPGRLHVVTARMRGRSSPGDDAALFLVFATADGRIAGEYRTQTLPKGVSGWRTQLLAATAPADAAWVSVGVAALRQPAGDWLEVAEVELKELQE